VIDIQIIRDDPERVRDAARVKNIDAPIDRILALDGQRRELITEVDRL
jgi:seryl-tRNA synthetase